MKQCVEKCVGFAGKKISTEFGHLQGKYQDFK